jgi:hypothetical protein
VFGTLTAIGGGGGGATSASSAFVGKNGGSGGGGGYYDGRTAAPGTGTAGQGNNGGLSGSDGNYPGGGGGGAGAAGAAPTSSKSGNGGAGLSYDLSGSTVFYAGGGGSVRGYDFQSIGPRDARNKPAGGASLIEASVEFRQRIGQSFGAVAFVDAGAVGTQAFAPTDAMRVGAGLGLRYYTPIGPIRADVALPLIRQQGSGAFGFYVGLGHAY